MKKTHRVTITSHLSIVLIGLVILLLSASGQAETRFHSIDLSAVETTENISEQLYVYEFDKSHALTAYEELEQVLTLSPELWLQATQERLSSPFKPKALWLTGYLTNTTDSPESRLLVVEPWRIASAQLYLIDPNTDQILSSQSSSLYSREKLSETWNGAIYNPSFDIELNPQQQVRFLLRIESSTFAQADILLADEKHFLRSIERNHDLLLILFGVTLVLFIMFLMQKNLGGALITFWIIGSQIFEYSYHFPVLYLIEPVLLKHVPLTLMLVASVTYSALLIAVLVTADLYRFKGALVLMGLPIAIYILVYLLMLTGFQIHLARAINTYNTLLIFAVVPLSIALYFKQLKRVPNKLLFFVLLLWILAVTRTIVAIGAGLNNLYNTNFPTFYLYAGAVIALIIAKYHNDQLKARQKYRENKLAQSAEEANQKLIQFKIKENERLKQIVAEKTAKLTEEKDRAEQESYNKSLFLSSASHELRSPLHDIIGLTELILNNSQPCNDQNIKAILSSSQQLLGMINDILQCSRGELNKTEIKPVVASLVNLAQELSSRYRIKCENTDLQFQLNLSECRQEWVRVDTAVLVKVLRNLLDNACKYTEQGEIELSVATFDLDQNPDQVRVRFTVSDTGTGISNEDQRKIFDPYYRVNHHKPGIGLGLTIVCQILKSMGSDLRVISQPDKVPGSRFTFDLILDTSSEPSEADLAEEDLPIGYLGDPISLLICDDNLSHQAILAGTLRQLGFTVSEFSDGRPAIKSLSTRQTPLPDLIISDQHMPHESGWSLLQFCKEDRDLQSIPFIMISAGILQRPTGVPRSIQVNGFMMKPFTQQELIKVLTRTLNIRWRYPEHPEGTKAQNLSIEETLSYPESLINEQDTFHRLVKNGQLLQLEEWSRQMLELHPEEQSFLMMLIELCKEIDLQSLRKLIEAPQSN